MKLHLNKELFRDIIDTLNTRTGIAIDIIEKGWFCYGTVRDMEKSGVWRRPG